MSRYTIMQLPMVVTVGLEEIPTIILSQPKLMQLIFCGTFFKTII